ncbi:MAG: mannose-6-phosphate isomerase [Bacteroidales bacterium]|nr:mannose-6-phosphate isomerase [Bacteroidales bacterium]MBD5293525.1 mannose-6-phosphate isomerase [Bacteroides sp.]MDE6262377.1 class I mannose-6-phosphate isomerase [Muribaculaceae bacterium]MBD5341795.1 mannose-6-phosphate isomerase [Bacteroides sp.]MBD5352472.1 mannose-6-phosphate isomerase [Bacteroides sp.]
MIFKFEPIWVPKPWGGESWLISAVGDRLSVVAEGDDAGLTLPQLIERYGASLVGERIYHEFNGKFPLLLKIIVADEDLSVQVHPNDAAASRLEGLGAKGKTEMWYATETAPGSTILSGLRPGVTRQQYLEAEGTDTIMELLNRYDVHEDDVFFLPAGRVHAIGAGCRMIEIQQSSDITYRIYDYGRPRELHLEKAREAITWPPRGDYRVPMDHTAERTNLVVCNSFVVDRYILTEPTRVRGVDGSFSILTMLSGEVDADGVNVRAGESVLVSPEGAFITPLCGKAIILLTSA